MVRCPFKTQERGIDLKIFGKYLIKSIFEKKSRTILLLACIAVSSALLIGSLTAYNSLLNMLITESKENAGGFQVVVAATSESNNPFFSPIDANYSNIKESFKSISIQGYMQNDIKKQVTITGTTSEDLKGYSSVHILQSKDFDAFNGSKVVISQKTSKSLKAGLGDYISLNINGQSKSYKVVAIAVNKGLFYSDINNSFTAVVPKQSIDDLCGQQGKYTSELLKLRTNNTVDWIKTFNNANKDNNIQAALTLDTNALNSEISWMKIPLIFILIIISLMSMVIIYSTFKLIILERIPAIGTFLSQGADKVRICLILVAESILYGVIGGMLGMITGIGFSYIISSFANPLAEYGIGAPIQINWSYIAIGFFFALVLTILTSLLPILKTRRLPVKDVILNTGKSHVSLSKKGFVIGILILVIAIILEIIAPKFEYKSSILSMILFAVSIVLVIPGILKLLLSPISRLFKKISGNLMLSVNNVSSLPALINNVKLITISLVTVLLVIMLSSSILDTIVNAYSSMNFNILVQSGSNNAEKINSTIRKESGIKNLYSLGMIKSYLNSDIGKGVDIYYVDTDYSKFENYIKFENKKGDLENINNNDDNIIISRAISKNYNIKKGDIISLEINNKSEKFHVQSICDPREYANGNYNIISFKSAKKHFNANYPNRYYISSKTSANNEKDKLENDLKGLGVTVVTKPDLIVKEKENVSTLTNTLNALAALTILIAVIGVFSNIAICFIQRKHELAVISSIGLSSAGRIGMIFSESLFEALLANIFSFLASFLFSVLLKDVCNSLSMDLACTYPLWLIVWLAVSTIIIMVIASLPFFYKSRKLNLVKELKYE